MELKNFFAQDLSGNIVPNPTVHMYLPGTTTPATGLQDENGATLTNPFNGTASGFIQLSAPDGEYDLRVSGGGRDFTMRVRFLDASPGAVSALAISLAASGGAGTVGSDDGAGGSLWTTVQGAINYLRAWVQAGVGTVTRTVRMRLGDYATFEDFLPTAYNPATDDSSTAIVTAATWSATNRKAVHFNGRYRVGNCAAINALSRVNFVLNNPVFEIADNGTSGTLTNSAAGKIGFLFRSCPDLQISGAARFLGLGTLGITSLLGMVFDTCARAQVPALLHFENMAAGRAVFWCDDGHFGDVSGRNIAGLATFEAPPTDPMGTLEDVVGCRRSHFGDATCDGHILPLRYLSVAFNAAAQAIDNEDCTFGAINGRGTGDRAQAVAVRSAVRCAMGNIAGSGWSEVVNAFIQLGQTGWNVDQLIVGDVSAAVVATPNDNALVKSISLEPTKPIGKITIGNVVGIGASGVEFGVVVTSGDVEISSLKATGVGRPVYAFNPCSLKIGRVTSEGQNTEVVHFGLGADVEIGSVDIKTGPVSVTTAAVRYNAGIGTGSFVPPRIGVVKYRQGGTANNYNHAVMDLANGFQSWHVGHIDGTGSVSPARFSGNNFWIIGGQLYATAAPTTGAYTKPGTVWNINTAAGGVPGWVLTTAGTSGVWSNMTAVSV